MSFPPFIYVFLLLLLSCERPAKLQPLQDPDIDEDDTYILPEVDEPDVDSGTNDSGGVEPDTAEDQPEVSDLIPEDGLDAFLCPKRFERTEVGTSQHIPYCANFDFNRPGFYPQVTRIVVAVHGVNSQGTETYSHIEAAASLSGADQSTLLLAPQFLTEELIVSEGLDAEYAFWTNGWPYGSLSRSTDSNPRPFRTSSYQYLDEMLTVLQMEFILPNLSQIVVVGHSEGGQMAQGYAAGSLLTSPPTPIKYVVANPSSYLYLSSERWVQGTEYLYGELSADGIIACPKFNEWGYGLEALYAYMDTTGALALANNYLSRDVSFIVGEENTDINDPTLSNSCESVLQGSNRFERGLVFYNYMQEKFPSSLHSMAIVPEIGHDESQVYLSECGQVHIFDLPTLNCIDLSK